MLSTKLHMPMFDTPNTRVTYGYVIIGNSKLAVVKILLNAKFFFTDADILIQLIGIKELLFNTFHKLWIQFQVYAYWREKLFSC